MTLTFGVLGPLTVSVDGTSIPPGPPQHRAVLAALLVDVGRVVDARVLIDRVWDERPFTSAQGALQVCISRLRSRLDAAGLDGSAVLATRAPGYLLNIDRSAVDAVRFTELVARARRATAEGQIRDAREHLRTALELWRGAPYADVRAEFAQAEADRLFDQRLAALELAAELDLALGEHAALADSLPMLVADHPLREGLRASLMLAWYRVGRQADALRLYEEGRHTLAEELGADPGPELQRLHELILRQDPALQAPVPSPAVPTRTVAEPEMPVPPTDSDALVGRTGELAALRTAATRAARGRPEVAVVHGEAGIGKTRLVSELERHLDPNSVLVWGHSFDNDGGAPYWPWAQALGALSAAVGPEVTAAALADRGRAAAVLLGPPWTPRTCPVAPRRRRGCSCSTPLSAFWNRCPLTGR